MRSQNQLFPAFLVLAGYLPDIWQHVQAYLRGLGRCTDGKGQDTGILEQNHIQCCGAGAGAEKK